LGLSGVLIVCLHWGKTEPRSIMLALKSSTALLTEEDYEPSTLFQIDW
jgi:hypothetical protein